MNDDGVQTVRGDTEAALRELCDLVDAALDESQAGLDGLAEETHFRDILSIFCQYLPAVR